MTNPSDPHFTEDELRAALRPGTASGAGGLDAGRLISRGRAKRARRRGAIAGIGLAAAVVIGSLGAEQGGAFGGDSRGDSSSVQADSANGAPEPGAGNDGAGNDGADTQLHQDAPFDGSDGASPADKYSTRAPIDGSPCEPERTMPAAPTPAGPASGGPLLDFAPTTSWACVYLIDGTVVATQLSAARTADAVAVLEQGGPVTDDMACTSEFGPALQLIVLGDDGHQAAIDAETYGCGIVTNGVASRAAKTQVQQVLAGMDDGLRPIPSVSPTTSSPDPAAT